MSPALGGALGACLAPCSSSSVSQAPRARSGAARGPLGLTAGQQRRLGSLRGASGASSSGVAPGRHAWRQQRPPAAAADADAAASLAADAAAAAAAAGAAAQQHVQQADAAAAAAAEDAADEQPKKKGGSLAKRVVFGTILGLSGAVVIVTGGWLYGAVACLAAFQCSKEYIGMVSAKGIAKGAEPPPPLVTTAISLLCVALNAWVFITNGRSASAMAVASFLVLSLQLVASSKPRFAQLASSVFGLFYCGYLPSFWIKLRLTAVPAVNSGAIAASIPALLGGPTALTVGMVATFITVCCIIAADTGAYFCGKAFGRTQLTTVSPKKTVEGAIGGLLSSIGVALGLYKLSAWPASSLDAAALGTIVFFASLFGDLIESVIKRDAGLKDASNLIPGHGGLLDRLDSYLFTGACVYFFIKFVLPGVGV
ncbi:Phosphatidate cytidylyltransferase [Chlorella sorokiniana]|uniref:Phosphatidate cytidylyltransferase n=1 Tax=Chlorella sorokiniana TaxID=3076 RepID=A0A2P6TBF9_CHLSO|nr:Phosphatidate cytidylyltransferase [Chlorella sorokiniana]|eukprot:PRW05876.1 Phosphatidate cytidylyltransferase [Chlorella sorokiniana]